MELQPSVNAALFFAFNEQMEHKNYLNAYLLIHFDIKEYSTNEQLAITFLHYYDKNCVSAMFIVQ